MRLLITGSRGQLGTELVRCLREGKAEIGPLPAVYYDCEWDAVDCQDLDIADEAAVSAWFDCHETYNVVVNCAAFTNVDGCEGNELAAYNVNARGAANLAQAAAAHGAKMVHVSTDYVFPGNEVGERVEDDSTGPLSAYGRTKLAGEEMVREACPRSFICRTAWLYGYVGKNFVKTMLRLAKTHGKISVVSDQLGNPTSANDLAYHLLKVAVTEDYGTYHMTNEGVCSWFDFACAIVDEAGIFCEKEPLSSAEYKERFPQSANRPHFSALKNSRLELLGENEFRPWRVALETYIKRLPELEG